MLLFMPQQHAPGTNLIEVRVALHADLRKYLPPGASGPVGVQLQEGSTVADLLLALHIPQGETVTVGVNGELAGPETALAPRDEVTMFSPMEGG